ncbi:MAG: response regulator [Acidobacteria bacterium]|nr:response regulator [Acidobacteriota bacterium]
MDHIDLSQNVLHILLLEDEKRDVDLIRHQLIKDGFHFRLVHVATLDKVEPILRTQSIDVCLADYHLGSINGVEVLKWFRKNHANLPLIFVSGVIGEDYAVDLVKDGATDYVLKDRLFRLGPVIRRALLDRDQSQQLLAAQHLLNRQAKQQSHLSQWSVWALDGMAIEMLAQVMAQNMAQDWGEAATSILLFQSGRPCLAAHYNWPKLPERSELAPLDGWFRLGLAADQPIAVPDFNQSSFPPGYWEISNGFQAGVYAPIRYQNEVLGLIGLHTFTPFEFAESEPFYLKSAAHILAVAIHKARLQAHIEEQAATYLQLCEAAPIGICHLDKELALRYMNPAGQRLFALDDAQSMIGRVLEQWWSPSVRSRIEDIPLGQPNSFVAEVQLDSGQIRRLWVSVSWQWGEPNAQRVLCLVDLTRQYQAEAQLKASLERFHLVVQASTDGFWDFVLPDGPTYASPRFLELLGLDHLPQINGLAWFEELLHPDDVAAFRLVTQSMNSQQVYQLECRLRDELARFHWFKLRFMPLFNEQNGLVRVVGSLHDIENRKLLEAQVIQSQKMEAIGRLAGGIAHDFNNLLTVILGYSQLLDQTLDDSDPRHERVVSIQQAGERAASLTQKLLAYSRRQILKPQSLKVNAILTDLVQMLRRLIPENLSLGIELDPTDPHILFDRNQLEQMLINLVVNARDALEQGGEISLLVRCMTDVPGPVTDPISHFRGPAVAISVSDNGHGMNPQTLKNCCEPFFTTKPEGKGTGLGLAMVHGTMVQSGGCLQIDSVEGEGTTVTLFFPLVESDSA